MSSSTSSSDIETRSVNAVGLKQSLRKRDNEEDGENTSATSSFSRRLSTQDDDDNHREGNLTSLTPIKTLTSETDHAASTEASLSPQSFLPTSSLIRHQGSLQNSDSFNQSTSVVRSCLIAQMPYNSFTRRQYESVVKFAQSESTSTDLSAHACAHQEAPASKTPLHEQTEQRQQNEEDQDRKMAAVETSPSSSSNDPSELRNLLARKTVDLDQICDQYHKGNNIGDSETNNMDNSAQDEKANELSAPAGTVSSITFMPRFRPVLSKQARFELLAILEANPDISYQCTVQDLLGPSNDEINETKRARSSHSVESGSYRDMLAAKQSQEGPVPDELKKLHSSEPSVSSHLRSSYDEMLHSKKLQDGPVPKEFHKSYESSSSDAPLPVDVEDGLLVAIAMPEPMEQPSASDRIAEDDVPVVAAQEAPIIGGGKVYTADGKLRRFDRARSHWKLLTMGFVVCMFILGVGLGVGVPLDRSPGYSRCFSVPTDLQKAVDDYLAGGDRQQGVIGRYGGIQSWCVNQVTNFDYLFSSQRNPAAVGFNERLMWNTSNAITMRSMFWGAQKFNQPLDQWDISRVEDMTAILQGALSFRQDLCGWSDSLSSKALVHGAFYVTNCPYENSPVAGKWMCFSCLSDWPKSFHSNYDLRSTVDIYVADNSENSSAAITYGYPISRWNVSQIKDFSLLFSTIRTTALANFSEDIGRWDVSKAINMKEMFSGTETVPTAFNCDISSWNMSNVQDISLMFHHAVAFNQPIGSWNLSSVVNISYAFWEAEYFNQPIGSWDVSRVTHFDYMFYSTETFNQPIGTWDVSKAVSMVGMFMQASSFNQPLNSWNVGNVKTMRELFYDAPMFDQLLDQWNVSKVVDMSSMFGLAQSFDQSLNTWDVSSVKDMSSMFSLADLYNNPMDAWNVSSVTNMQSMFAYAQSFNQPLGLWNVQNVVDFRSMFFKAHKFNQDLSSWPVNPAANMNSMFRECLALNQNFCPWGSRLNASLARTHRMFTSSGCMVSPEPKLAATPPGPFCYPC